MLVGAPLIWNVAEVGKGSLVNESADAESAAAAFAAMMLPRIAEAMIARALRAGVVRRAREALFAMDVLKAEGNIDPPL